MSSNVSLCTFPNGSFQQHQLFNLDGKSVCGNPTYGHPTQYHTRDNRIGVNNSFVTPPSQPLPSYPIKCRDFTNNVSNQVLPMPNYRIFLPIIKGETQ